MHILRVISNIRLGIRMTIRNRLLTRH